MKGSNLSEGYEKLYRRLMRIVFPFVTKDGSENAPLFLARGPSAFLHMLTVLDVGGTPDVWRYVEHVPKV